MKALSKPSGKTLAETPADKPQTQLLEFVEPWRCDSCKELMYNKNADGYPAPGAPIGLNITVDGKEQRVCLMCAEMYIAVLKNDYFVERHKEWVKEQEHKNKLKTGNSYLDR